MLEQLRRLTIAARLNVILALVIIGFLILLKMEHSALSSSLIENKQKTPQSVVELAWGIVEHYHQKVSSGLLSEPEAQQRALEHIKSLRYDEIEYLWVNDMDHVMLMHPIKPALEGKSLYELKDPEGTYLFREFVTVVRADGAGFVDYYWPKPGFEEPVHKISFVKGYKPWGWVIGSGLYTDDVREEVNAIVLREAISLSAIVLVIFGALYLVNLSITRPIKSNTAMMKDIASGEGDLTRELAEHGNDETAGMARDFNVFVRKLKAMMGNINESISQLSASASVLSNAAESSARCASEQRSETDQTASAINQLSASAVQIARSAEQASENSREAMQEAANGRRVVEDSVRTVSELAENMMTTRRTIDQLHSETENIGSLLTVIQGIAEQTNLLALNAAIEAARAGEQGRGFAVVADEVRTLAGKTQQATEEIDEMIAKLQEGAASAVSAMESSTQRTEQTKEQAMEADRALASISEAINMINDMNSQIATASEQQSQVSEEINRSVSNIVHSSEENAENSNQVLSSSADLDRVRDQLTQLAAQFKI